MIKLEELTPKVYYNQSRDFQFIGRLYDLVLNSVKTNTELVNYLPLDRNTDQQLLSLAAFTLGFKIRHNYNVAQLTALCNVFSYALKNKGNIKSIVSVCDAVLNAEGIKSSTTYVLNGTELILYLPKALIDITLLRDLLDYILPAGMSCTFIKESILSTNSINTLIDPIDTIEKHIIKQEQYNDFNKIKKPSEIEFIKTNIYEPGNIGAKEGYIANSNIYKPGITNNLDEEK